jgi:hypothetical protein
VHGRLKGEKPRSISAITTAKPSPQTKLGNINSLKTAWGSKRTTCDIEEK